jgi:hypothetical protein
MGAGRSGKANLVQTRQNKKGKTCKCQGGGSGGDAGCGHFEFLDVNTIVVVVALPIFHLLSFASII